MSQPLTPVHRRARAALRALMGQPGATERETLLDALAALTAGVAVLSPDAVGTVREVSTRAIRMVRRTG